MEIDLTSYGIRSRCTELETMSEIVLELALMKPRFKSGSCGGTQSYTGHTGRSWSVMVGAAVHSGAIKAIRIVIVGGWYLGRSKSTWKGNRGA